MRRRLNVTLPEETVRLIDRTVRKGKRSHFINLAVRGYVEQIGRSNLRRRLKEGATRRAERDLRLAEDWFPLEETAWRKGHE